MKGTQMEKLLCVFNKYHRKKNGNEDIWIFEKKKSITMHIESIEIHQD